MAKPSSNGQTDILARLSIYTLSDPSPTYASLLSPLLTPKTIPHTLLVILLDWSQPWNWIRQLRDWIRLLRNVVGSLPQESKVAMEFNVEEWRDRKRHAASSGDGTTTEPSENDVVLPPGPGEWDEPLGIPLCVVAHNADKIEQLEKERGWKDDQFDFIMQYLRTVLLKHGASLVYTMASAPGPLQTLIHSSLDVQSTLQKKQLKHNITDRDHILIPPNWDSWGRIRIMADNFDVEAVSRAWSHDIDTPPPPASTGAEADATEDPAAKAKPTPPQEEYLPASLQLFSDVIKDPKTSLAVPGVATKSGNGIEVPTQDTQSFLSEQAEKLKGYTTEDDKEKLVRDAKKATPSYISTTSPADERKDVEEHIGPVQFNMGGIQVDADEMVKRLKVSLFRIAGSSGQANVWIQ
jgi:dynein light intermediate chain 1, cytosolic